jgi:hypothetical protein
MGKPWNNESAEKWWACGRHVLQKELAPSAKVRRTTPEVVRAPPRHLLRSSSVAGVARARGRARLRRAAEQASCGVRRRGGGPRGRLEGGVALSQGVALKTGWAVRLGCEQRGRLAAAVQRQLRGVRQRVQTVVSARECARERATRKRSRFQSASVCVCGHRGVYAVCSRPRTNAITIGQSLLASPDQRRNSWCVCSRHLDQRTFGG